MKKQIMSKRRFATGDFVEGEAQNMPRSRTAEDDQEAADKAAGLAASNKEKSTGFFERLRMGNIDDPSSEAYKRLGAGRGRAERIPVEDKSFTAVKAPSEEVPVINNRANDMASTYAAIQARKNAEAEGEKITEGERIAQAMASKPDRVSSLRPSVSARPVFKPAKKEYDPTAGEAKDKAAQAAADEIGDRPKPAEKPKAKDEPKKEMYRNLSGKMVEKTPDMNNPMMGLGDLIGRGAKAAGEAFSNYKFMTPAERRSEENRKAKEARGNFNANKMKNESLGSFDKGSSGEYKRGGSVASSRADGIAQRGKTRGKMC